MVERNKFHYCHHKQLCETNNLAIIKLDLYILTCVLFAKWMQVIRLPVDDCLSQTNCTSCLSNGNPLCGWCVVENKCSRRSECSNSDLTSRWLHASALSADNCPAISVIFPKQYLVHSPQRVCYSLLATCMLFGFIVHTLL